MTAAGVERWLYPTEKGLYCEPGDFYIDPSRVVSRAIITHGHGDHARPGHQAVLATPETIEVMKVRMGPEGARSFEAFEAGTTKRIGRVDIASRRPATSSARLRSCSNTTARERSSRATISAGRIPPARPSNSCPATCS